MRMVSPHQVTRIKDYAPMEMDIACLHSEVEDCESIRTISPYLFTSFAHYEIMHMVSSYLFLPRIIRAANLAENRG